MSGGENVSTTIGVTTPAVSQAVVSTTEPEVVTPQPRVTTPSTTPSFSQPISLVPRSTSAQQVTFPQVIREYQRGMPSSLMHGVHTSPSTYADNSVAIFSPFHHHNASGSAVNNNLRVSEHPEGVSMGQQSIFPPLINYSLQVVR
jgi:hypothetical protein